MLNDLRRAVSSLLVQKRAVAERERDLIARLRKVLPAIGYEIRPTSGGNRKEELMCPRCSRTFRQPLHLGRHLSATHGAKKRVA